MTCHSIELTCHNKEDMKKEKHSVTAKNLMKKLA